VISNVPALRALVSDVHSLPFDNHTSRGLNSFVQLGDLGFVKHKDFVYKLGNACALLEAVGDGNLGPDMIQDLIDAIRKIDEQFVEYEEYDASALFNRIMEILNDVGDRSALRPEAANQRPNAVLMAAQDKRILEGELLRPLP
jgi:hypothetical protein